MTAWQWVIAAHLTVWAAMAVLAWRHYRAGAPTEEPQGDDLDAIVEAVTTPRCVLVVVRKHTGALSYSTTELTVGEALTVADRLFSAALAAQYRESGLCEAETFANGEQT